MNPWDREKSVPNFWLSCLLIDEDAMAPMVRGQQDYLFKSERGKSSPQEILDAMAAFGAEGRPIWKPMHLQPLYQEHDFVTRDGNGRKEGSRVIGADIFRRGLCLPSDNKMLPEDQDRIIEIVRRCFR
jgi:dTDP-4-amino-4,6-dideoxygalactose transaminase